MNLIIDQGNSFFKVAVFNPSNLIDKEVFDYKNENDFQIWLTEKKLSITKIIISSVVKHKLNLDFIPNKNIHYFNENSKLPIINSYQSPKTLGKDRLANAVAAWCLNPSKNSLVIDLGTCIKYDIVNQKGEYLGGNISPGLNMRFKSLHHFTDQLPELNFSPYHQTFGVNTETSIYSGVQLGIENEINGFIERYSTEFNELTIFMTGGDLKNFEKRYKKPIFANQNLTLIGLNEILHCNE